MGVRGLGLRRMERRCAGVIDAAGLARGEMGEDGLDEFGRFDARDDTIGYEARDRLLIQPTRRLRPNRKRSSPERTTHHSHPIPHCPMRWTFDPSPAPRGRRRFGYRYPRGSGDPLLGAGIAGKCARRAVGEALAGVCGGGRLAARRRRHDASRLAGAEGRAALARGPGGADTDPSRARRSSGGALRDVDQSLRPSRRADEDPGMDGEGPGGARGECEDHRQDLDGTALSLGRWKLRLQSAWSGLRGRRRERTVIACPEGEKEAE